MEIGRRRGTTNITRLTIWNRQINQASYGPLSSGGVYSRTFKVLINLRLWPGVADDEYNNVDSLFNIYIGLARSLSEFASCIEAKIMTESKLNRYLFDPIRNNFPVPSVNPVWFLKSLFRLKIGNFHKSFGPLNRRKVCEAPLTSFRKLLFVEQLSGSSLSELTSQRLFRFRFFWVLTS